MTSVRIEHFNHHPPTEHWFWWPLRVETTFVVVWVQQRSSSTFLEQKILRTDTLKRGNRRFHFVCVTLPLRQHGLLLGETLWQTTSLKGERESVGVSVCPVSPTCETVPKRPSSLSPNPDYWSSLQSGRTGRGWNTAARAEVIKETLLNTSLFFLLTVSWTPSGILLMSHGMPHLWTPADPLSSPTLQIPHWGPFPALSIHGQKEQASADS